MSLRVSLVLMVLFVGLGYYAFFEPLRTSERDEEKAEHESHVVWLKDKTVDHVSIAGAEKDRTFALSCVMPKGCPFDGSGEWKLIAPTADRADSSAVGTLLSSILNLTQNEKLDFDKGYDAKEFGLDTPSVVLGLALHGEKTDLVLTFGKASAVGPNVYLSVSSDPNHLYLVPNYLPGMVNQEAFHWQNKRLFPVAEATAVSRIEWKSKKLGPVVAVRAPEGWRLEKPRSVVASKIMFEGLGSTLSYAAAKKIFSPLRNDAAAKKALSGAPELEVTFFLNGGDSHNLKLWRQTGGAKNDFLAVVTGLDPVYVVDASVFDRFGKDLTDYRQRSVLTDADRSQVDEVKLEFLRDKNEITLALKDGLWAPKSGATIPGLMSQERFNGFLDGLRDGDFKVFLPVKGNSPEAKAWLSETPDVHVELLTGGKKVAEASFLVFDRKAALTESEGDVRALVEPFLKFLPVRLSDLSVNSNRPVITEKGSPDGHSSEPQKH